MSLDYRHILALATALWTTVWDSSYLRYSSLAGAFIVLVSGSDVYILRLEFKGLDLFCGEGCTDLENSTTFDFTVSVTGHVLGF